MATKNIPSIVGIIDLGTNTFQLMLARLEGGQYTVLHEESRAAKIGQGGISEGKISPEGIRRAVDVLRYFVQKAQEMGLEASELRAIGTSAIRNAHNRAEFCQIIQEQTGIQIEVIDGAEEAQLIFEGVRLGVPITDTPVLVMDIGGGSVEFIVCNNQRVFWKQSFEIGGQRLMDQFMDTDPISGASVRRLMAYLDEALLPLSNALHQYAPSLLIGSAGSFETLADMFLMETQQRMTLPEEVCVELPLTAFRQSFLALLSRNREERLALPGMIPLRVDMIVVGVCLIQYVLEKYQISAIKVSSYALKEGVLSRLLTQ
jgi:exopolyphosphatase / guanosine-5'-triphosphate,3'-diphosphate pyrophosphatase